jgi:hypothetical protein
MISAGQGVIEDLQDLAGSFCDCCFVTVAFWILP